MPPRSPIDMLPEEVKAELNSRLRANGYSDLVAMTEWLTKEHGCKTSKTALGRYSYDLKTKDNASSMIAQEMHGDISNRQAIDLLVELGALRIKEHRIIKRLEDIGYIQAG